MLSELNTYPLLCLMNPDDVVRIREMVTSRFPAIEMGIDPEASAEEVRVIFCIPRKSDIPMYVFFTALSEKLNQGAIPREKGIGR